MNLFRQLNGDTHWSREWRWFCGAKHTQDQVGRNEKSENTDPGAPNGTVLQNVSWLVTSAEYIMNSYICGINCVHFQIIFKKYVAIVIIIHIAIQIEGQELNMKQLTIMSLVPHLQIGVFYEDARWAGWQVQNRYLKL